MTVIAWLLANPLVSFAIAGVLGFLTGIMKGRLEGGARERAKRDREELKARDVADEIDDAIAGRSSDANRKELRKWSRG